MNTLKIIILFLIASSFTFIKGDDWNKITDRNAFLVGIEKYDNASHLKHPISDTKLLGTALEKMDYRVGTSHNATKKELLDALVSDYKQIPDKQGTSYILYFAGQGVRIDGMDYILPTDTQGTNKQEFIQSGIPLSEILEIFNKKNVAHLILLDMCRNNPFEEVKGGSDMKAANKKTSLPSNIEIVYATTENKLINDDNPFAESISEAMLEGGCLDDVIRSAAKKYSKTDSNNKMERQGSASINICFSERGIHRVIESDEDIYPYPTIKVLEQEWIAYPISLVGGDRENIFHSRKAATSACPKGSRLAKLKDWQELITKKEQAAVNAALINLHIIGGNFPKGHPSEKGNTLGFINESSTTKGQGRYSRYWLDEPYTDISAKAILYDAGSNELKIENGVNPSDQNLCYCIVGEEE